MTGRVVITRPYNGIIAMQVCVVEDATDQEILEVCNRENMSGTTLGWTTVQRNGLDGREDTKPVTCESYPERRHLLVTC